ncbi:MAG: hypothetical protein WD097_05455 [Balneolales bacterium]
MKVVVKDANILIDFANGSLFTHWFRLGYETWSTDMVLSQVQDEEQWKKVEPHVHSGALNIHSTTEEFYQEILAEPSLNRLGPEDTSALLLARELDGMLLTGDRQLRKQGEIQGIEVHGVLWVLEKFVQKNILRSIEAAEKLVKIIEEGALLPHDECDKLLKKWNQSR